MFLGELAADGKRPLGIEGGKRGERAGEPARRLEGDERLGVVAEQPLELNAGAAGQKALEAPAGGGQPGDDERGASTALGPGRASKRESLLDAGAHELMTGI